MSSPASSWIALEQCWKSIRDISELVMQLTIFEDELCRNKYCLATAVSVLACILLLIVLYSRCIGRAPHFVFYSRQNWPCPTLCILLPAKLAVPHTLYSTPGVLAVPHTLYSTPGKIGRAPHFVFYSRQNWPCPTLCILLSAAAGVCRFQGVHGTCSTICLRAGWGLRWSVQAAPDTQVTGELV
jgi:hypothetical protein